jgi:hypothetical protein
MNLIKYLLVPMFLVFSAQAASAPAPAAIPEKMDYSGYLYLTGGGAVTGTKDLSFSIYTASSGGTALWTEAHASVPIANGLYNIELGSITTFTSASLAFNIPYYLGVTVENDSEMSPRKPLLTSAYSFATKALSANGTNCTAGQYPLGIDVSGNVESCTAILNSTAPTVGNSGTIGVSGNSDIALSWTAATDDTSTQAQLAYTIVYSTDNNISSVATAEANGSVVGLPWSSNVLARNATGLGAYIPYYFNVIVRDSDGNKSVYIPVTATPTPNYVVIFGTSGLTKGDFGTRAAADALCTASTTKPAGFTNVAALVSIAANDSIAGRQSFSSLDTNKSIQSEAGIVVANNWADLLDGVLPTTLANASVTFGNEYVFTASDTAGNYLPAQSCNGWTHNTNDTHNAGYGHTQKSLGGWINDATGLYCGDDTSLMCIAW